jgi:hypothetical protein
MRNCVGGLFLKVAGRPELPLLTPCGPSRPAAIWKANIACFAAGRRAWSSASQFGTNFSVLSHFENASFPRCCFARTSPRACLAKQSAICKLKRCAVCPRHSKWVRSRKPSRTWSNQKDTSNRIDIAFRKTPEYPSRTSQLAL